MSDSTITSLIIRCSDEDSELPARHRTLSTAAGAPHAATAAAEGEAGGAVHTVHAVAAASHNEWRQHVHAGAARGIRVLPHLGTLCDGSTCFVKCSVVCTLT